MLAPPPGRPPPVTTTASPTMRSGSSGIAPPTTRPPPPASGVNTPLNRSLAVPSASPGVASASSPRGDAPHAAAFSNTSSVGSGAAVVSSSNPPQNSPMTTNAVTSPRGPPTSAPTRPPPPAQQPSTPSGGAVPSGTPVRPPTSRPQTPKGGSSRSASTVVILPTGPPASSASNQHRSSSGGGASVGTPSRPPPPTSRPTAPQTPVSTSRSGSTVAAHEVGNSAAAPGSPSGAPPSTAPPSRPAPTTSASTPHAGSGSILNTPSNWSVPPSRPTSATVRAASSSAAPNHAGTAAHGGGEGGAAAVSRHPSGVPVHRSGSTVSVNNATNTTTVSPTKGRSQQEEEEQQQSNARNTRQQEAPITFSLVLRGGDCARLDGHCRDRAAEAALLQRFLGESIGHPHVDASASSAAIVALDMTAMTIEGCVGVSGGGPHEARSSRREVAAALSSMLMARGSFGFVLAKIEEAANAIADARHPPTTTTAPGEEGAIALPKSMATKCQPFTVSPSNVFVNDVPVRGGEAHQQQLQSGGGNTTTAAPATTMSVGAANKEAVESIIQDTIKNNTGAANHSSYDAMVAASTSARASRHGTPSPSTGGGVELVELGSSSSVHNYHGLVRGRSNAGAVSREATPSSICRNAAATNSSYPRAVSMEKGTSTTSLHGYANANPSTTSGPNSRATSTMRRGFESADVQQQQQSMNSTINSTINGGNATLHSTWNGSVHHQPVETTAAYGGAPQQHQQRFGSPYRSYNNPNPAGHAGHARPQPQQPRNSNSDNYYLESSVAQQQQYAAPLQPQQQRAQYPAPSGGAYGTYNPNLSALHNQQNRQQFSGNDMTRIGGGISSGYHHDGTATAPRYAARASAYSSAMDLAFAPESSSAYGGGGPQRVPTYMDDRYFAADGGALRGGNGNAYAQEPQQQQQLQFGGGAVPPSDSVNSYMNRRYRSVEAPMMMPPAAAPPSGSSFIGGGRPIPQQQQSQQYAQFNDSRASVMAPPPLQASAVVNNSSRFLTPQLVEATTASEFYQSPPPPLQQQQQQYPYQYQQHHAEQYYSAPSPPQTMQQQQQQPLYLSSPQQQQPQQFASQYSGLNSDRPMQMMGGGGVYAMHKTRGEMF